MSFTLVASSLPLAGCASQPSAESDPKSASQACMEPQIESGDYTLSYDTSQFVAPSERYESYDDGSEALDVVETYISSNASTQDITIVAEDTAFAPEVSAEDVTLTGSMVDWKVTSVERKSDTELVVKTERPEGVSPFGNSASAAGVELSAGCLEPVAEDFENLQQVIDFLEDPEAGDAWLAEHPEASQPAPDAPEPLSVTESVFAVVDESDPAASEALEAMSAPLSVSIPFVVPFMAVDVADTHLEDGSTALHLVASNFVLPETLSVDDFSIGLDESAPDELATPELLSVTRLGDFEFEAVVSGNALEPDSAFDFAVLTYDGEANGTGGDIYGSLLVPDSWVHAAAQANDDEITIDTVIFNSDDEITDENTTIGVLNEDGTLKELSDVGISTSDEGISRITLDANALDGAGDTPIVVIDPDSTTHASGAKVDPDPYFVEIPASDEPQESGSSLFDALAPEQAWADDGSIFSKIASWASSLDLSSMAFSAAKSGLGSLAQAGWAKARTTILQDTFMGDRSNMQIYNLVSAINDQMSELSTQVKQLSDTTSANYYGTIVNNANDLMTDIKSDYTYVADLYSKVLSAENGSPEQDAAIKDLMDKRSSSIESLFKNMNRLAAKLECADATRGYGLIASYDVMAEKTYNWAGTAAAPRIAYRASLGALWSDVTSMLYVVCGSDAYKDEYKASLAALEDETKKVNDIIANSEVKESEYEKTSASYNTESGKAYYCYTTASWYELYKGSDSKTKWNDVYLKKINKGKLGVYSSSNPFSTYVSSNKNNQWNAAYMNAADVKLLAARCRPNSSLQQEIRSFVSSVPKYFLVGAKFECDGGKCPRNQNDWTFDVYTENETATSSTFEAAKTLFKSETWTTGFFKKTQRHEIFTETPPEDMFVLAKVS